MHIDENHEWYKDIVYFLRNMSCPDYLIDHQRRDLRLKAEKYALTQDGIGRRNPDGIILKCVNEEESKTIIKEIQAGMCSGHYAPGTTITNIMRAGYYWPTLFKDVHSFVRTCKECQFFSGKLRLRALPLNLVVVESPFQQWGMDFIGPFDQNSSNGYKYQITLLDGLKLYQLRSAQLL